jgi:hypothetical protein
MTTTHHHYTSMCRLSPTENLTSTLAVKPVLTHSDLNIYSES